ncbi:unnamed protein product [Cylindrotheca closterium]|uniref:Uncharacterized protein n=1 Tax=Cylindrotheca closterium TaxID=2856 RepID=A0AAD2CL51_9STRA|nr:unnamed protein product [Cylindrotheca closterium]
MRQLMLCAVKVLICAVKVLICAVKVLICAVKDSKESTKRFKRSRNDSKVVSTKQSKGINETSLVRKKKLRPGKGAIAEILTKFINAEQPNQGSKHRSMVVLEEEDKDDNQRKIFRFYYDGDEGKTIDSPLAVALQGKAGLHHFRWSDEMVDGWLVHERRWFI